LFFLCGEQIHVDIELKFRQFAWVNNVNKLDKRATLKRYSLNRQGCKLALFDSFKKLYELLACTHSLACKHIIRYVQLLHIKREQRKKFRNLILSKIERSDLRKRRNQMIDANRGDFITREIKFKDRFVKG